MAVIVSVNRLSWLMGVLPQSTDRNLRLEVARPLCTSFVVSLQVLAGLVFISKARVEHARIRSRPKSQPITAPKPAPLLTRILSSIYPKCTPSWHNNTVVPKDKATQKFSQEWRYIFKELCVLGVVYSLLFILFTVFFREGGRVLSLGNL